MKYLYIIFCFLPFLGLPQSGISISGSSQFYNSQTLILGNNNAFYTSPITARNNQMTLSVFRGKKYKIGTLAIKGSLSYNVNIINYSDESEFTNHEIINRNIIPALELWYIFVEKQSTFIYSSIGTYGTLEELNLFINESKQNEFQYNSIVPFIRLGMQVNYGKLYINPFLSFDLEDIRFENWNELVEADLNNALKNYTIRSGIEFGIMF